MTKFLVMSSPFLAPWSPTFRALPDAPTRGGHLRTIFASIAILLGTRAHIFGALHFPLCNYLNRAARRLAALLDAIEAGTLRAPRQRPPRERAARPPARPALPAKKDWLGRTLGWEIRGFASQLEHLLNQPETQALLVREPARAARILRPLARMLGIAPIALPPPPSRKPTPRKPRERKPRARRPTRAEIIASLHYTNLEGRPMRLLPPRNRR